MTPIASASGLPSPISAPLTHTLKFGEAVLIASGRLINIQLITADDVLAPKTELNIVPGIEPVRNTIPPSGGLAAAAAEINAPPAAGYLWV